MSLRKIVALLVFGMLFTTVSAQDTVKSLQIEGQKAYQAKTYDAALAKFESAIALSKKEGQEDITIVYQAAMAAYKATKYDKSIALFNKSLEANHQKCKSIQYLSNIYGKADKDGKQVEMLKKGIAECPKMKGKFTNKLAKAYLVAGADKYNAGAKIQTDVSTLQTTDPKYTAALEKANKEFKASLVDLEASYALNPKNKNLLTMLSTVYTNLEMKDKAAKMDGELKAMK